MGEHYRGMKHRQYPPGGTSLEGGVEGDKFLPPPPEFSLMSGGPEKIAMGTGTTALQLSRISAVLSSSLRAV